MKSSTILVLGYSKKWTKVNHRTWYAIISFLTRTRDDKGMNCGFLIWRNRLSKVNPLSFYSAKKDPKIGTPATGFVYHLLIVHWSMIWRLPYLRTLLWLLVRSGFVKVQDPNTGETFPGTIGRVVVHDFCTLAKCCYLPGMCNIKRTAWVKGNIGRT